MNGKINDGGPAFPVEVQNERQGSREMYSGMSLRHHYAGRALTGLLVSDYGNPVEATPEERLNTARVAFAYADAMIKAGDE